MFNYRYQEFMGTLGDTAIYNFEKNIGCPERWLLGPVSWARMAEIRNEVYFQCTFKCTFTFALHRPQYAGAALIDL